MTQRDMNSIVKGYFKPDRHLSRKEITFLILGLIFGAFVGYLMAI